ncbi:MAG: UDP-N-acetylglucosamine 2-epimerase (non-hydrolyzing) [Maribacter sp.]|jgi:UDP-N-acetylglucosamine 2-epimerase (non-hydrolysing)
MKIISVVGARPNFMKVAPLHKAFLENPNIISKVVHTGQHYDERMSSIFFEQLKLPKPDYYLGVGSGSHAVVTAKIMMEFEQIILIEKPDLVLVVGDVNSTLACALVAKKMNIKLAHVEAGLRSGDREMPEEINRILTDSISDYLFVTEQSGMIHLAREGVLAEKIFFVGNVMIDSLCHYLQEASTLTLLKDLDLQSKEFVLMTMHRPSNVDEAAKLEIIIDIIQRIGKRKKVVLPLHPRTAKQLEKFRLLDQLMALPNLTILEPQGYLQFIHLMENSAAIVTDSGGIQEETTFLKVPCLTLRTTTERPVTITLGTNTLIEELDADIILKELNKCLDNEKSVSVIPPLWDGRASQRIAEQLYSTFTKITNLSHHPT